MPRISLFLLALSVASAALAQGGPPPAMPGGPVDWLSPMGEPFAAPDAAQKWFRGADTDGDGALTSVEFIADARRFHGTLDLNKDGRIDADEMRRYETEVLRPGRGMAGVRDGKRMPLPGAGGPPGGRPKRGDRVQLEQPQPVASADTDLNRSVTQLEFDRAAMRRFQKLDQDNNRKLTLEEVQNPPREM